MAAAQQPTFGPHDKAPRGLAALEGALRRRPRAVATALSALAHLAALIAIFTARPEEIPIEPPPMVVQLVEIMPPVPVLAPPAPSPAPSPMPAPTPAAKPAEAPKVAKAPEKKPPRKANFRRAPATPEVKPLPAGEAEGVEEGDVAAVEFSEAQIAGAARVGTGGGGGGSGSGAGGGACDMLEWLQQELRKDVRVQRAVASAHTGKPLVVWTGDWVRHPGQEGGGLATVREAMMWEIAFAPEECRARPVRGLVLISLGDGPGAPRIAFGRDQWRWSDLLHARKGT